MSTNEETTPKIDHKSPFTRTIIDIKDLNQPLLEAEDNNKTKRSFYS